MASYVTLPSKDYQTIIPWVVDCSSQLYDGETVTSAIVTSAVFAGVDSAPEDMITTDAEIEGNIVTQYVEGGEEGVTYLLSLDICTSLTNVLKVYAYLSVLNETPMVAL
mgnify:CR=1 FL=1